MSALVAQRQLALAGIALLCGVFIIAFNTKGTTTQAVDLPQSVPAPGGGWFSALASPHGAAFARPRAGGCGFRVGPRTLGIAHPVLPCKAKLYISYGGRVALTQVVARGAYSPGHDFEISPALASKLQLGSTSQIRWRYAR